MANARKAPKAVSGAMNTGASKAKQSQAKSSKAIKHKGASASKPIPAKATVAKITKKAPKSAVAKPVKKSAKEIKAEAAKRDRDVAKLAEKLAEKLADEAFQPPPNQRPVHIQDNSQVIAIIDHIRDEPADDLAISAWFRVLHADMTTQSWVHEISLWRTHRDLVVKYWRKFASSRNTTDSGRYNELRMTRDDQFYIARIVRDRKLFRDSVEKEYLVEWVGCEEMSWEPEETMEVSGNEWVLCEWLGTAGFKKWAAEREESDDEELEGDGSQDDDADGGHGEKGADAKTDAPVG